VVERYRIGTVTLRFSPRFGFVPVIFALANSKAITRCRLWRLLKIVPKKIPACGANALDIGVSFGGYDANGKPFVYLEFLVGSWGGGQYRDGMDACTGVITNDSNTPGEVLESEHPLALEGNDFVPDTGGAGRFRGGLAMERRIRFLRIVPLGVV